MEKDISLILPPEIGLGAIYISDLDAAKSSAVLKQHRIGAIISVTKQAKLNKQKLGLRRYLHFPVEDNQNFDISQYFSLSFSFIEEARKVTNILVHCIAGISRSATIVAAYLIQKYSMTSQSAINLIKKKRNKISPNKGFRKQLQAIKIRNKSIKIINQSLNISPIKPIALVKSLPKQLLTKSPTKEPIQKKLQFSNVWKGLQPSTSQFANLQKKQKIIKKIQKIKMSLVSKLKDTQDIKRKVKTQQSQPISFLNLLQSKIYQNKIKIKVNQIV